MLGVAVGGLIAAELAARHSLGLGDPPLLVPDPDVEYLLVTGQYHRFGNAFVVNRWGMRSEDRDSFDVLVVGDSVVNGGSHVDQSDLATEIVARRTGLHVANIAASSWGPPNMLAYMRKFGTFNAKSVVIVLSSHDRTDAPTFEPGAVQPTGKPLCALTDGFGCYVMPRLQPMAPLPEPSDGDVAKCTEAIAAMIALARDAGARVAVVHHREQTEPANSEGRRLIFEAAAGADLLRLDLPESAYRDQLHLDTEGQARLADVIERWLGR